MNEQRFLLIFLVAALTTTLGLYLLKANNSANITNGILILLLAVLPFFIDPQTTLSFQRVITLGLLYIGTRNLIELAATVYFDKQL